MKSPSSYTIEIIVSPAGQSRITPRGYAGTTCRDATRELERALGTVQTDVPTAEMFYGQSAVEQQTEGR